MMVTIHQSTQCNVPEDTMQIKDPLTHKSKQWLITMFEWSACWCYRLQKIERYKDDWLYWHRKGAIGFSR